MQYKTFVTIFFYYFPVFEVLDNDTIVDLSREIQNGKVILCDDVEETENNIPSSNSKLCKLLNRIRIK